MFLLYFQWHRTTKDQVKTILPFRAEEKMFTQRAYLVETLQTSSYILRRSDAELESNSPLRHRFLVHLRFDIFRF